MEDPSRTHPELIKEISFLKQRIKELEQSESDRRQTEDKYRTLIETTDTGFVIIDKGGLVLDANPEYVRLTGHHDLSEIVGRSVIEWTADSEKGKNTVAIKAAMAKGYIRNLEIDYVDSKGSITPIEINATSMEIEGEMQTITICRDITERKRIEDALRDSRQRYKSLIESANEGIFVAQGNMLRFVNPAFVKIIGYSEFELTAKPFIDFIHPEDRDMVLENHIRRMRGEQFPSRYEFRMVNREGVTKDVEIDSVMIRWDGKPAALGFINDITVHKQMEEALNESEEKYRNIFENTVEGIYQTTPEGRFMSANPAAARLLGYESPEELISTVTNIGSQIYVYPEDREKTLDLLMKEGFFKNFEVRNRKKDGSIVWVLLNSRLVRDDQGNILYIEGTNQDITLRKLAEEELKQHRDHLEQLVEERTGQLRISENKYRTIFENANDAIFLMRQDILIDCNAKALELFGCTKGQIIGQTPYGLSPPFQSDGSESREKAMEKIAAAASGTPQRFEWQYIRNDGTVVDTEINLHVVTIGEERILQALVHDITERKHAEETIKKAEEQYKSLVETVSEWIWEVDANGVCLYTSPRIYNILGYKPEEVLGKTPFDFMPPEESKRVLPIFEKLVAEKKPILSLEGIHYHKDGHIVFHETNGFPFFDKEGSLLGYRGSYRDITEQKQIMDELQQNKNDLEAKSKTLEELNTTLKVLLHQRGEDKKNLEDRVASNVKSLVIPYIEKIKKNRLDPQQLSNLTILETNLNEIISPFLHNIRQLNLTPRETRIASLVKDGKTTKEIAEIIGVATSAVDSYRNSIRTKLGLNSRKVNLQSYLQSLT